MGLNLITLPEVTFTGFTGFERDFCFIAAQTSSLMNFSSEGVSLRKSHQDFQFFLYTSLGFAGIVCGIFMNSQ